MAKRRAAEPLTFHVPCKRFLPCELPEGPPPRWAPPPGAAHPARPRKRRIDAGAMAEPSASPSKRRDGGEGRAPGGGRPGCGLDTGEPPRSPPQGGPGRDSRERRAPGGGGDRGAGRAGPPRQHNEEFWQYNSFQYWRNPLPPIDLADIEDVSENRPTEAPLQGKNEVVEIDMES